MLFIPQQETTKNLYVASIWNISIRDHFDTVAPEQINKCVVVINWNGLCNRDNTIVLVNSCRDELARPISHFFDKVLHTLPSSVCYINFPSYFGKEISPSQLRFCSTTATLSTCLASLASSPQALWDSWLPLHMLQPVLMDATSVSTTLNSLQHSINGIDHILHFRFWSHWCWCRCLHRSDAYGCGWEW